jgi:hypothetical protein
MRATARQAGYGAWALLILLPLLAWALLGRAVTPARTASSTPVAPPEAPPMHEATIDDVTIGLMAWQPDAATPGRWAATLHVVSAAELPVRFVSELIFVTVIANDTSSRLSPLPASTLPCTLNSGEQTSITLLFTIEPNQTAQQLTVGIEETNRSGAHVVFPLGTGAVSAKGGDGAAGANATGGNATGANATAAGPPATPASQTGSATPSAGACAH